MYSSCSHKAQGKKSTLKAVATETTLVLYTMIGLAACSVEKAGDEATIQQEAARRAHHHRSERTASACPFTVLRNSYDGANWWGTIAFRNDGPTTSRSLEVAFDVPAGVHCDYTPEGWSYSQSGTRCAYRKVKAVLASGASLTLNYSTDSQGFSPAAGVRVSDSRCTDGDGSAEPEPAPDARVSTAPDARVSTAPTPDSSAGIESNLVWRLANLTYYTSYPDPGSEECIEYNGCQWAGQFAAIDGKQSESWVRANNIAAVHSKDFETYKLKTLRLRQGSKEIDVKVYDMCADSDCSNGDCCTVNATANGLDFLIDIESFTADRFGSHDGIVEWACIDCD